MSPKNPNLCIAFAQVLCIFAADNKQGLNQTIEKLSADFRYYKMFFGKMSFYRLQSQ